MKYFLYIIILFPLIFSCEVQDELKVEDSKVSSLEEYLNTLDEGDIIPGHYIVSFSEKLKSEIRSISDVNDRLAKVQEISEDLLTSANRATSSSANYYYSNSFIGFAGPISERTLQSIMHDERVNSIEEDAVMGVGNNFAVAGRSFSGERSSYGLERVNGGEKYTGEKKIFVVDTGIDEDHKDLNVDKKNSYSAFKSGFDRKIDDRHGHGSHVAGIIGAKANSIGVIGVAAGAPIIAVKVLDRKGKGSTSTVLKGFDYIQEVGEEGDVVNMSFGGGQSDALDEGVEEVADKGLLIVAAAGNEETNVDNISPAGVDHKNVLTISSMDDKDRWSHFSNYGRGVDYCAPGEEILSCYRGGDYAVFSGTSMAAPHVAGILLLGEIRTDGNVKRDPDSKDDPIAVH